MDPKEKTGEETKNIKAQIPASTDNMHIGSGDAFEETENPLSRDADNISDEKLDELLGG